MGSRRWTPTSRIGVLWIASVVVDRVSRALLCWIGWQGLALSPDVRTGFRFVHETPLEETSTQQ